MESGVKDQYDTLAFVEMFEAAEQSSDTARQVSERCRDYYDNKQFTEEEAQELRRRGQPVIVDNVIAGKINWLIGQEMSTRTDPKAFPRTPQHQQGADAATDAIRFVCDNTDWDLSRSRVWENMLVEGFGGVEVIHRETKRGVEVEINHYPWDRLFYDPHSREDDFSDARYLGAVIWQDRAQFLEQHPEAADAVSGIVNEVSTNGETYEDRPRHTIWGDKDRNRVRVVMLWYREAGAWKWCKFTKGYKIDAGESPYVDEDGGSVCPLIMQSAYVDRENRRYGEVLKMLDMQDEINKRRSKLLHMATSRQTVAVKGAVGSVAAFKREMSKPDGHIEITTEAFEAAASAGTRPFDVLPASDMAASQFALLQEAKVSLSNMSAAEALQGRADGDSGRAVLAKQQGAMQAIAPLLDKLRRFTRRVFEAIWNRIRQFWTEERWVRVTDDERNARFVGFNRPVTLAQQLSALPEQDKAAEMARLGVTEGDPRLSQFVGVENPVEQIEIDIIVDEVPDQVSLAAETFEQLVNIDTARGGVLPLEMLIEASPLRADVKEKVLTKLQEQTGGQQQQQMQAMQQQMQAMQAQMAALAAKIERDRAATAKDYAAAQKMEAEAVQTLAETQLMAAPQPVAGVFRA